MTDFRALCAELLQELEHATDWDYQQALKDQARAALAQHEPQDPTRKDLCELFDSMRQPIVEQRNVACEPEVVGYEPVTPEDFARAVLARWGK